MDSFAQWVGKTETRSDTIAAGPSAALSATLDRDDPFPQAGDALPPLWHWMLFLDRTRASEIGPDGHARRGGFLPPAPLPRRMWAGGRIEFHHPLHIGEQVTRESSVVSVQEKTGRSGPLVFVVVRHRISGPQGLALTEEQDLVYRDHGSAGMLQSAAPTECAWERTIHPDEVLLFRYSALTFNAHRIHYDRVYTTKTEGYPGLVVHGQLIASLLMDLLRRNAPQAIVTRFNFRAASPIFDTGPFVVCGNPEDAKIHLWAKDAEGNLAMTAEALLNRRDSWQIPSAR